MKQADAKYRPAIALLQKLEPGLARGPLASLFPREKIPEHRPQLILLGHLPLSGGVQRLIIQQQGAQQVGKFPRR